MNNNLLFLTVGERFSLSASEAKAAVRRRRSISGDLSSNGVASERSSERSLDPTCLVEAGAQDNICMHIFTYMCFHLSLNTFNVYSEVIWCLSLSP